MAVLPTRPLGRTGMDLTAAGLGAWAIGGLGWEHAWGPQDDRESVATIGHAVERGVNWIDWRGTAPEFTCDGLGRHLALVDRLRPVAARHGVPLSAVAVAWTLSWPGVTGAIVGARRPGQVDGWLPAAFPLLTGEDLDEIAAALHDTAAGTGPVKAGAPCYTKTYNKVPLLSLEAEA
jgi:aryl-alcohol dehydrogenase-like predicted oxidoreductase